MESFEDFVHNVGKAPAGPLWFVVKMTDKTIRRDKRYSFQTEREAVDFARQNNYAGVRRGKTGEVFWVDE